MLATLAAILFSPSARAQQFMPGGSVQSGISASPRVDIPQTNLSPVAPPPANFGPPPGGFGQIDPYAIQPGTAVNAAPASPLGMPGPSVTFGAPSVIAPSSPNSIAPSPPGSSLLSRMFSRPASSPMGPGATLQGPVLNSPPVYGNAPPGGYLNGFGSSSSVYGANPNLGAPNYGAPNYGAPGYGAPNYSGGGYSSPYATPTFPNSAYPSSSPSTLFPGGMFSGGPLGGMFQNTQQMSAYRLLQGPRLRHTFVMAGDGPNDLQTNDTDVSVIFAFPNFLYSTQPLYIVPSFSLHLWDGPDGSIGADLPANAYSGFLDIGWQSDANQMFGTEFGVRVGAFTDFDTFNNDSIRVLGKGLASFRMTPTSTLKAGVYYVDRNSIKLIPAGGILWQPNPYTRFDLFFPQPKLACYWRTIGTRDVWWYLTGDYGGGSWTIQRTDRTSDSIDINEIRAVFGMEWGMTDAIRSGRRNAFFEIGYVFDREVEYRFNPQDNFKPDDGVMFRAGIGY